MSRPTKIAQGLAKAAGVRPRFARGSHRLAAPRSVRSRPQDVQEAVRLAKHLPMPARLPTPVPSPSRPARPEFLSAEELMAQYNLDNLAFLQQRPKPESSSLHGVHSALATFDMWEFEVQMDAADFIAATKSGERMGASLHPLQARLESLAAEHSVDFAFLVVGQVAAPAFQVARQALTTDCKAQEAAATLTDIVNRFPESIRRRTAGCMLPISNGLLHRSSPSVAKNSPLTYVGVGVDQGPELPMGNAEFYNALASLPRLNLPVSVRLVVGSYHQEVDEAERALPFVAENSSIPRLSHYPRKDRAHSVAFSLNSEAYADVAGRCDNLLGGGRFSLGADVVIASGNVMVGADAVAVGTMLHASLPDFGRVMKACIGRMSIPQYTVNDNAAREIFTPRIPSAIHSSLSESATRQMPVLFSDAIAFPGQQVSLTLTDTRDRWLLKHCIESKSQLVMAPRSPAGVAVCADIVSFDLSNSQAAIVVLMPTTRCSFVQTPSDALDVDCADVTVCTTSDEAEAERLILLNRVGCQREEFATKHSSEAVDLFSTAVRAQQAFSGYVHKLGYDASRLPVTLQKHMPAGPTAMSFWLANILPANASVKRAWLTCDSPADRLSQQIDFMSLSAQSL